MVIDRNKHHNFKYFGLLLQNPHHQITHIKNNHLQTNHVQKMTYM